MINNVTLIPFLIKSPAICVIFFDRISYPSLYKENEAEIKLKYYTKETNEPL